MEQQALYALTPQELEQALAAFALPRFRVRQIDQWLQKGVPFSQMTNLPPSLRQELTQTFCDAPVTILRQKTSALDGTIKLLYSLRDGNCVEGVLMRYQYGHTLCVSTQVGCRMGCRFCASTLDGCVRNLSADEMLCQIHCTNTLLSGERVRNVVLMGSGEPLDNYEQVTRFLRAATRPDGMNMSVRHFSLSTCGLVPKILAFADEGLPVTLSLSLHAPTDDIRKTLMPIANVYTISQTLDACAQYIEKTGRRVIIEYALIRGVNSEPAHADALAGILRGMQCHVNLIPLNTVKERNLYGVTRAQAEAFLARLQALHISSTIRREMGDDIDGACGQLRKSYLEEAT